MNEQINLHEPINMLMLEKLVDAIQQIVFNLVILYCCKKYIVSERNVCRHCKICHTQVYDSPCRNHCSTPNDANSNPNPFTINASTSCN